MGLQLKDLPTADVLITEATYGVSVHPSRKQQEAELVQAVIKIIKNKGNVLIPAFALGRTQEIILALKTSPDFCKTNTPIYLTNIGVKSPSPMG